MKAMRNIILASASPRRRELLSQAGVKFEVRPASGEEKITSSDPEEVVKELSEQKALAAVFSAEEGTVIIGSDTLVAYQGKILGKPCDEEDAVQTLMQLQGNTHQVYTGVSLIMAKGGQVHTRTFFEATDVTFYPISKEDLRSYAETGDSLDKAGAYGIQGPFAIHVKCIRGDYNNVVGLPVSRLYQELLREYVSPLSLP